MNRARVVGTRREFLIAGGALLGSTLISHDSYMAHAQSGNSVLRVGEGGDFSLIEEALFSVTVPSISNRYVIELLPGIHIVDSVLTVPRFVSIVGYGRQASMIHCTGNYSCLKFCGDQEFMDFGIRADRTSSYSSNGVFISCDYGKDLLFTNLSVYLTGGWNCAIYVNYFSAIKLNNVHIWTTSIGIKATGYLYLTDCHVRLSGNGTDTPYYGLTCFGGNKAAVRYSVSGGFFGVGYGSTDEEGFGGNGFSVLNDGDQDIVVFHIPEDHTKRAQTGTRFQLTGVECYARNEHATSDVACHCVKVDGAGIVRLFGGLYQAEMPSWFSGQPIAVVNNNYGTHDTAGLVETYGARITSQRGNVSSFRQDPVGELTVADHGIMLNSKMGATYLCDASEGAFEVKLPAEWAKGSPAVGSILKFIKTDNSGNWVLIRANGAGATIEGLQQVTLENQFDKVSLLYGGSERKMWFLM